MMPDLVDIHRDELSASSSVAEGVRQVSRCRLVEGCPVAEGQLENSDADRELGRLSGERNLLSVTRQDGTIVLFQGRGAGRWPTTESVLADRAELAAARQPC